MNPDDALASFLAKFTPDVAARADAILAAMRARLPGALELVYDNYNALAIGFSPTEKVGDVIFSIAVYPRWVSLFFFHATTLPDPEHLLQGSGTSARHIVLDGPEALDRPAIRALMADALAVAVRPIDPTQTHRVVIKSISPKQRDRRPKAPARKRG